MRLLKDLIAAYKEERELNKARLLIAKMPLYYEALEKIVAIAAEHNIDFTITQVDGTVINIVPSKTNKTFKTFKEKYQERQNI